MAEEVRTKTDSKRAEKLLKDLKKIDKISKQNMYEDSEPQAFVTELLSWEPFIGNLNKDDTGKNDCILFCVTPNQFTDTKNIHMLDP